MEKRSERFFVTFVSRPVPFIYILLTGNECGQKPIAMHVISGQSWGPSPIIDILFQTNDVRWGGGGGGSEPVRLEEKSALNFFWTGLESRSSPAAPAGRRPCQWDPRLRHLAAASRGRDPPV